MGPDDTIYLTDDGDHTVRKYTLDGKLLLKIGTSGQPAPFMSGMPFHRCSHTALAPNGDICVSDGYGNARVHRYTPDGRPLLSWGEPGTGPGQFNIVHNICCDADGHVYVADRENHRIQVFDGSGKYQTEWRDLYRPCGLCMCGRGRQSRCYVAELAPGQEFSNRNWPGLGPRVSVLDGSGRLLARLGDFGGPGRPSPFIAPHGMRSTHRVRSMWRNCLTRCPARRKNRAPAQIWSRYRSSARCRKGRRPCHSQHWTESRPTTCSRAPDRRL